VHRLVAKALADNVPVARLVGFRVEEAGDGRSVLSLRAGPRHANPMGTLHGGVICDVADAAMGIAFASTLEPEETFTTITLSVNFFRPVWEAELRAEGRVVRKGKTTGYLECDVLDDGGRHIARATSVCLVLRGDQAKGR
jgi:uncharacterized protein (TIGR00369 family)